MRRIRIVCWALSAGILSSLIPSRAYSWGKVGHEAVALVAQNAIKKDDPALYEKLMNLIGRDEDGNLIGMGSIAACADGMKGHGFPPGVIPGPLTTAWCPGSGKKSFQVPVMPFSSPWHYIDIPYRENPKTLSDIDQYCVDPKGRPGECVTAQIHKYAERLQTDTAPDQKRLDLLMIVHLYGDLHQPMHCINDSDLGGNTKRLHLDGMRANEHSIWDNMIETHVLEKTDYEKRLRSGARIEKSADYVGLLEADIKRKDALKPGTSSGWLQGDLVEGAALESFYIAKNTIYPLYFKNVGPDGEDPYLDYTDNQYYDQLKPIVENQIEKAGIRLAYFLEQIMDPGFRQPNRPQSLSKVTNHLIEKSKEAAESFSHGVTAEAAPSGASPVAAGIAPGSNGASATDNGKWAPSPKFSEYEQSVEFHAVLKVLGKTKNSVEQDIQNSANEQAAVDRAIYAKAWPSVYAKARESERGSRNWAVVFDIDETVLDNSPYQHKMDRYNGGAFNAAEWSAWVNKGAQGAEAIAGAREFMQKLHRLVRESHGRGHVVFISDRNFTQDAATIANLDAKGLYQKGDIVLSLRGPLDTKEIRRTCIEHGTPLDPRCANYPPMEIIALFGDSLRDFVQACDLNKAVLYQHSLPWGEKDWPLWNDEYGQWERNYACGN